MFNVDESSSNIIKIHNISSKTIDKFKSAMHFVNERHDKKFKQNPEISRDDCKQQFNTYYHDIQNVYNDCFLDTVDISNKRNFIDKPWISVGIAHSCKVKNKLHVDWINARKSGAHNVANVELIYKSYRTKLTSIIRAAQCKYYKDRFNKCRGDLKKVGKL